ncbi:Kinesin-like protein-like protein [Hapsidospora chrysogenum ATCC 11550]|uniref:Kinesin-like protein-like protein n=1 Tax=Hapsidospora chrysogenum (strain ATCC 11550 / CBS 779.69 / DSM 880 / IAM 14645 / JCM 23072 / IMI 49137) TaxID=857340 RepID=A0A086T5V3_HAPC1|nr:Kinesin-like protein-like protein [Hapsidospora chrysogenum ATCC 11550]
MAGGGNIKVVVRVRPFNGREIDRGAKCIVEMKDNQTILTAPDNHQAKNAKDTATKTFAFDRSYWSFNKEDKNYAGQSNLFTDLGGPLLDNAFEGYNNCIFAYGQTGSGKSYSMMGYGKEIGIIPQICQEMFRRIEQIQSDGVTQCTVEVSYLEIYNERVRDLLNPSTKGNLRVREHPSTGPYVEDLAKLVVGGFQEIENLMDEGNKARTVAATNMNETSSRSHAVFTLMLTQKKKDTETNMEAEKVAKISLVDLAGSERATSTGATGARLKEGAEINRSLSTLGRVIAALADMSTGKKKKGANQVPYRDSVLTWLLKDSLGGNSMTAMIAAISPADINYDETLSTLRYADSAKRIKNHAVINEDANARMIRELKEELALLRSKLGGSVAGGTAGAAPHPDEVYDENTPLEKQMVSITSADGTVKKVSKADIAEQLSQSEKLLTDLNQTWEQKLQKTEEIHKEREAALEELGISIEKGFIGLSTPKKMPHLVNLSDDPLLAECLVYNLKPGTTTVGNVDTNADNQANIRLNGTRILHDHCKFENAPDGTVTVVPSEGASVMVNGKRIEEPKQLHSGYRVILGDFHIFRFNHPMEARAERAEERGGSLLRHSITASQLQAMDRASPSPTRPGHERTASRASEFPDSRPESPAPFGRNGRDSDWSMARREAAGAILGSDQNFAKLTDEELNALFEDVQKARAERVNVREDGEDSESVTSYPTRDKYMSSGTIDNFSLDTALTMPSTPKQSEGDDRLKEVREEMQNQLEKQKEEFEEQLKSAEAANVEVEEIRKEKTRMEAALQELKEDMQKQLIVQRKQYEEKLEKMDPLKRPKANPKLSEEELERAKQVLKHWRSRHYVKMAESVLQNAAILKEAQIMSNELEENVVFQFTVVDVGHAVCSSYDMMLNGLTFEGDDVALEEAQKPCIGIRVVDYRTNVVHLWSLQKLHDRVRQMRQMHQYLDQPEYAQHLSLDNPFVEGVMPSYTLVGEADVPLRAVFESRVQDFTLDVLSPYTTGVIGIIRLSLEPSQARAPSNTLKFNVVMHEMIGFAEREGTEVHAQLFIPGVSEEDGITTTQMIKDFDEGPIRFESVHSMSVPLFASPDVTLRVAIFANASAMHLDKLLSWDDMRDGAPRSNGAGTRINESQFFTQEKHDLLSRIQIKELDENGEYVPVEVAQTSELDTGTFQLHQGIQRRISIDISHSSGDELPWGDITTVRVGRIRLLDSAGRTPNMSTHEPDVTLKLASNPVYRENANGTRSITVNAQWDSSLHGSLLLDRVTAEKYRVQLTISWEISSEKLAEPMKFAQKVCVQIMPRSFVRQASLFSSMFQNVRFVRTSTGIFTLTMRPAPIKRVGDLWRLNSQHDYVKGEENLQSWAPRGVSLISDFIRARKKRRRIAEIGAMQTILGKMGMDGTNGQRAPQEPEPDPEPEDKPIIPNDDDLLNDTPDTSQAPSINEEAEGEEPEEETIKVEDPVDKPEYDEQQTELLETCLKLWRKYPDPLANILSPANTAPPTNGVAAESPLPPSLITTIVRVPKNPKVLKGGYLLVPNNESTRWQKRFVELRRPYLHIHSATDGDEVGLVSLRNARVDSQPGILGMLHGDDDYGEQNGGGGGGPTFTPGHRRTASGRVISTIWTGAGGASSNGGGQGLTRLSERMQAGVFAIYGTDNTWLFAARSERDKMDWILRIDQTFLSNNDSATGSGVMSPQLGSEY